MRRVKHILSYVLSISMCFTLFFFPVSVKAESVYWSPVSGCINYYTGQGYYGSVSNDSVIGIRWSEQGSSNLHYAWYSSDGNTTYSFNNDSSCSAQPTTLSSINLFNETDFYRSAVSPDYNSSQYLALYNGGTSVDSSTYYGLAYLVNSTYSIDKLTFISSGTTINSWVGPSNPYTITPDSDIYIVGVGSSSCYLISESPNTHVEILRGSSDISQNLSSYVTINGTNIYYSKFNNWSYNTQYTLYFNWYNNSVDSIYPYAGLVALGSGGGSDPVITYGKPYDVEYSTRIAGSGLASADNIDRIVWNRAVDTNGNELPTGARVQIRAVPGKYVGNTATDVLNKTYRDFILDHSKQLIIVDIIASRGVYETKWSEVVEHFGFFPYSWVPNIQYIDNEYFKMGWIYQIRLQVKDYYSDWTNIYTATGSGASESQTITDSDDLTQQLVQDINIINQLNNTTTVNWYINETTINNSEYTENTDGKPWWAYLLEAILSLFQIGDGEQQTINNTNNLNIDLNDKLNEYNEIEDQQLNNLDTNLEAIEVESDILENNKFVGSANWVAQQYTRMTNGTVIGSLIGFSLLFGLALIFIGKIR